VRLLVFGAGGSIGRRIVLEAIDRDHEVTAAFRKTPEDPPSGAQVVVADVRRPAEALDGRRLHAVISAVGAGAPGPRPDYEIYLDAARSLTAALRAGAGPRLIVVGGAGSLDAGSGMKVIDTPQFPSQFRQEALAQARALEHYRTVEDVPWTYVSPAAMIEPGERTGRFRTGRDELLTDAEGHSRITIEDYAAAIVDELEQPQAVGRRMTVAY
jgi:uncharacterized protein